jgi:hypothetical protein
MTGYEFDTKTGQLFFNSGRDRRIVGDIDLAIAWTTDEDIGGCLHKHGNVELVRPKADAIRMIDPSLKMAVIPWEAIRHEDAGPRILEEVNLCLEISGRVSGIEDRIASIAADYEIEIFPRDTSEITPNF